MTEEDAAILRRLRAALETAYGERLRGVVLFGSRARGDHRPDSDFDLAVFLDRIDDRNAEVLRLNEIGFSALDTDTAGLLSLLPFPDGAISERTPLMHDMRREGIRV